MAKNMNKADLTAQLAKESGLSKAKAAESINIIIGSINKALAKGGSVSLVGFGTFSVAKRKARTGRNPQTGETMKIPAKKVPKFSAGKGLKDAVAK
jgi:DNA-binding protein HU-beta